MMIAGMSLLIGANSATAAGTTALLEAQKLEGQQMYSMAAAAYMAIMDEVDFVPSQKPEKLSSEEKIILGKCAISCLEQGIQRHIAEGAPAINDCSELPLLLSVTHTLSVLEPSNPRWTKLNAKAAGMLAGK